MQFNLKTLAAAVVLAAAAGHAAADIQPGNSASTAPNSELVFFAFGQDAAGKVATYVKDLGVTFNSFASSLSYSSSFAGDTNWTAFNGAGAGANLVGDKYWGVFATQRNAGTATAANTYKMMVTGVGNYTQADVSFFNNVLINSFNNLNTGITDINGIGTNYAANSSYFYDTTTDGATNANLGKYLGMSAGDGSFLTIMNKTTTTAAQFYTLSRGTGTNAAGVPVLADVDGATGDKMWAFNGSTLVYAPVPEPETYSMMAAGLLVLGAIARRRRAA